MKIIEAYWEKRNLGITCAEIEIGKNDPFQETIDTTLARKEQYIVAKVIHGRTDILFELQKGGFLFIETLFETEMSLKGKPIIPAIYSSLVQKVGYHVATATEQSKVIEEVRNRHIFSTDRVALDPHFSKELAGQRYAFWIEDIMVREGSRMIITEYEGNNIGFNVFSTKGKICEGLLGGLFIDYLDSGLGFANSYASLLAGHDLWGTKIVSHVSSNNFQMFKLHLFCGMNIRNLIYVLVRHNNC